MFITIDNIKYHLKIKGEGKPMICLHGFSENLSTWNSLELEGYKLVLIDIIGHGKSDKPNVGGKYRLTVIVKHLNKLIHQLHLKKYSMLGYSMGGRIALAYALSYSNEIDKLILESASYGECGFVNRLKRQIKDVSLSIKIRKNGIEWFNEYWSGLNIFQSQKKLQKSIIESIKNRRLSNEVHVLSNILLYCGQGRFPCLKNKVINLSMPILYISGEVDKKYMQMGYDFTKLNTNIKHEIIKGVGHNTHIENSKVFNEVLNNFLQ